MEEQQSCYDACKSIKHTCLVEHYSSVLADSNIYEAGGSLIILCPGRHVQNTKYHQLRATRTYCLLRNLQGQLMSLLFWVLQKMHSIIVYTYIPLCTYTIIV